MRRQGACLGARLRARLQAAWARRAVEEQERPCLVRARALAVSASGAERRANGEVQAEELRLVHQGAPTARSLLSRSLAAPSPRARLALGKQTARTRF